MRSQKFFQGLTLTTFTMGVFNTLRGNKVQYLQEKIIKQESKYEELNHKYTSLLENNIDKLERQKDILEESQLLQKDVELLGSKLRKSKEMESDLRNSILEDNNESIINERIPEVIKTSEEINEIYESVNNKLDLFLNKINTFLNNSDNKSQYLDSLQNFFDSLNYQQNLAIVHISGSLFILITLINIISIFYGEKLIIFFDLENKFPKIAKFIQLRRKFQHYYLLINIALIFIVLIIIIFINIIEFISYLD